ncbi:hypothetical protein [Amycolatopsis sp. WGS_07]|uniref:hypothetical protein n=1 Tax=Amycolatopsis sp. WGS_07 TaxID=3076764 RepID=UPI003873C3FB
MHEIGYRRVLDRVTSVRPPAQPDEEAEFEVWCALVEAEAEFAGLLATAASHGRVDASQWERVRRSLERIDAPEGSLAEWREALRGAVAEVCPG